jgi:hypothetical protein
MIMLGVENLTIPYIVPAGLIVLALSVGTIELFGLIKRLVLKLVKKDANAGNSYKKAA